MSKSVVIDLGYQTYEIKAPDGEVVGSIRINPSDPALAGRWQKAEEEMERCRAQIEAETAAGKSEIEIWPLALEASDKIKNAIDYAFGSRVSDVLFGGNSAFAFTMSGKMVLENVLEAITPIMQKALETSARKAKRRMEEHTAPYQGTTKGLAPGQAVYPAEATQ